MIEKPSNIEHGMKCEGSREERQWVLSRVPGFGMMQTERVEQELAEKE